MLCQRCKKELTTQERAAYGGQFCEDCFAGDHPATHFNVLRDMKIKTKLTRVVKKSTNGR